MIWFFLGLLGVNSLFFFLVILLLFFIFVLFKAFIEDGIDIMNNVYIWIFWAMIPETNFATEPRGQGFGLIIVSDTLIGPIYLRFDIRGMHPPL